MKPPSTTEIVVGVDGSALAAAALDWAVDEASRRGAPVMAVTVWPRTADAETVAAVAAQVDRAAARRPDVPVGHVIRTGLIADTLLASSDGAAMLVLGSHGTGKVLSALLGSVAAYCIRHARVPVVLVPNALAPAPADSAPQALTPGPLL